MTEREVFENKFSHLDLSYVDDLGYCESETQTAWEAWQASASREGYKLVPVETLQESLGWACIAEWDSPNKETDEEIRKHKSIIEKAMVGAVE